MFHLIVSYVSLQSFAIKGGLLVSNSVKLSISLSSLIQYCLLILSKIFILEQYPVNIQGTRQPLTKAMTIMLAKRQHAA